MSNLLASSWPLLLLATVVLLTFGLGRVLLPNEQLPYEKRPSLINDAERQLFRALAEASGPGLTICPMVRLADIIRVRPQTWKSQSWQSRILPHRMDFVLCEPATLEARVAVQLVASEDTTDEFLDAALGAAKLPLLRVATASEYNADELRQHIQQLLGVVGQK